MPLVTVCVPAYRSAQFIGHTLAALRDQTFRDFQVRIAVEPRDTIATVDACLPFLDDPRFDVTVNQDVLGWDGNVRALLQRVDTPLYAIQLHDDVPHPGYLEALVEAIAERPDASVAFSDVYLFGTEIGRRGSDLPDAGPSERELAFFMGGAEGHPFRGLSRREVLTLDFPMNEFTGFAVETEWAHHLVRSGVALRVARPLYFKRARPVDNDSVTNRWRHRMEPDRLRAALEHNRARLLSAIGPDDGSDIPDSLVRLAAEAAMFRRWHAVSAGRLPFGVTQLGRATEVLKSLAMIDDVRGRHIAATVHVALSCHWQVVGDHDASERSARAAVEGDPSHVEACLRLASLLWAPEGIGEMVDLLARASEGAPLGVATQAVAANVARTLRVSYRQSDDPPA